MGKGSLKFGDFIVFYTKEITSLLERFRREEDGNMAVGVAIGLTTMLGVVGATLDYSAVADADSKAQSIADSSALAAAVYVRNNGVKPKDKNQGLVGTYTAAELGHEFPDWVKNGANGVSVSFVYDEEKQETVVTVSGETLPLITQIMGHDTLPFKAEAVVKYAQTEKFDPASIALVLDGSGSMQWFDKKDSNLTNDEFESVSVNPGAMPRNTALKAAAKVFMTELETIENLTPDEKILRTGMYVYSNSFHSSESKRMNWGALPTSSSSKLMKLRASGGTNAYAALKEARVDMLKENGIHKKENGSDNPLKYVILMTDGVNSPDSSVCTTTPRPAHKHWERRVKKTTGRGRYQRTRWVTEVMESRFIPWYNGGWVQKSVGAGHDSETFCMPQSHNDKKTLDECRFLGNKGIKVFTIGYGLEEGYYHAGHTWWENYNIRSGITYEGYHVHIPQKITDRAYNMLQSCADLSGGEFITADNATELTEAFSSIGKTIATEAIRISN